MWCSPVAAGQFPGLKRGDRRFPVDAGQHGARVAAIRADGDEPVGEVFAVQSAAALDDDELGAGLLSSSLIEHPAPELSVTIRHSLARIAGNPIT
jgi:hypothetical protein